MATQEPGIQKIIGIKGPCYRVQIRLKGCKHVSKSFDTFQDAKEWKRQTISAMQSGQPHETTEMRRLTVGDLIERFIQNDLSRHRNYRTIQGHLNWWRREIGHCTLNHFREDVVAQCRDKLLKEPDIYGRPRSPATVNRYICSLAAVVTIAMREWRLLSSSPLKYVRKLSEPRGRERFLTQEERGRLLQACKESACPFLYLIVLLALSTGMRKGEIVGLTWGDVDLQKGRLVLRRTKNGDTRVVCVQGPALTELQELSKKRNDLPLCTEHVFPGRGGRGSLNFRTAWETALQKAEIKDYHFHDNRHDYITTMSELGYPLHIIGRMVGHRSNCITATRYTHLNLEHADKAADRIGLSFSHVQSCS